MRNEILSFKDTIALDDDYDNIVDKVSVLVYDDLYSYFVGRKGENIVIKVCYSETPEYNTINKAEATEDIITRITDYMITLSDIKCITFRQPPLELMIRLYQPMLGKMVDKLHDQWKMFDYEDLMSMANYVMVKLYRGGYYVNRYLVWTSLNNEVLIECRKFKHQPLTVAFEDVTKSDIKLDSEELTYGDMIEDESYKEEEEKEDEQQLEKYIFEQVKNIVIEKIGERQWDRLFRDYSKGHTTNASRQSMRRVSEYIKELGLTRQDFINHYRR